MRISEIEKNKSLKTDTAAKLSQSSSTTGTQGTQGTQSTQPTKQPQLKRGQDLEIQDPENKNKTTTYNVKSVDTQNIEIAPKKKTSGQPVSVKYKRSDLGV